MSAPLPGIVITGASGRMGQMLIRSVSENDRMRLAGAVERKGHDWVGRDVGEAMGGAALGVTVTDDAQQQVTVQAKISVRPVGGSNPDAPAVVNGGGGGALGAALLLPLALLGLRRRRG